MTDLVQQPADGAEPDTETMADALIGQWLQDVLEIDRRYADSLRALDPEDYDGSLITAALTRTGRTMDPEAATRTTYLIYSLARALAAGGWPAPAGQAAVPVTLRKFGEFVLGAADLTFAFGEVHVLDENRDDPDDRDGEPV